jgi:UDP-N-acetylmuramoyl-tripeptide--D-alanyl-D-alanine ligase
MRFDGTELAQATRGECIQIGGVGDICTDTRKLKKGDWFLAIVGERFDGHSFSSKAKKIGVSGIIGQYVPEGWDRGFICVEDSLIALQNIARHIRKQYTGLVVAITGSAGKTTTRALVASVLSQKGTVLATAGNFNNHIGLPLTLLRSNLNERFWVLELGMNHLGEIHLLQEISQPHIRLITNVGAAHLEGVGSLDGVAKAKGEIFNGAHAGDLCVRNADDQRIMRLPLPQGVRTLEFGEDPQTQIRILSAHINIEQLSTEISLHTPKGALNVSISSPGLHLASNVASAVGIALDQGCSIPEIKRGIEAYKPVGARLRVEQGPFGTRLLNDAYNANPLSMRASVQTLSQLKGHTRIALLGDMLELGDQAQEAHTELLRFILSLPIEKVGVCGSFFAKSAENLILESPQQYQHLFFAENSTLLGKKLAGDLQGGEIILLKGSRGIKMEHVINVLEEQ